MDEDEPPRTLSVRSGGRPPGARAHARSSERAGRRPPARCDVHARFPPSDRAAPDRRAAIGLDRSQSRLHDDIFRFFNQPVRALLEDCGIDLTFVQVPKLAELSTAGLSMSYKLGPRWDDVIPWSDFKSETVFGFLSPNYTGQHT